MDHIEELISSGIPLTEKAIQVHGHKENGVNYCVISHFKNGDFIQSKIEHIVTDAIDSLDLNKKSDESSSGLDMDKGKKI